MAVAITVLSGVVLTPAQVGPSSKPQSAAFAIDREKPFAYIEFIKMDRRKALPGEPDTVLWLRFVNNCRVPIGIKTMGTGDDLRVEHEVVYTEEMGLIAFRDGKRVSPEKMPRSEMPKGYSFELPDLKVIQPGDDFRFSIPTNHVSKDWYILLPFEFMLEGSPTYLRQPSMEVSFSLYDLPPEIGEKIPKPSQR
jgi:hypothetical protein